MKKIEAIIKPSKLNDVKKALNEIGVAGLTAIDVKGFAPQNDQTEFYRGAEYPVDLLPKVEIVVVVDDALLSRTVEAIMQSARTGKGSDGKIFVSNIEEAVRIHTGEREVGDLGAHVDEPALIA